MNPLRPEMVPFHFRALRALAWLLLVFGLSSTAAMTAEFFYYGMAYQLIRYPFSSSGPGSYVFYAVGLFTAYTSIVLQVVGSAGLLKWRSWSRLILLIWSILRPAGLLLSTTSSFLSYVRISSSGATQPATQNMGYLGLSLFVNWLSNCALPIMTLWLLNQREVVDFWSRPRGGGFDVIPMAQLATPAESGDTAK